MSRLHSLICLAALHHPAGAETRVIPPPGNQLPASERSALSTHLQTLDQRLNALPKSPANANAGIFLKAVRYALDHGEFFKESEATFAHELLAEAGRRIDALSAGRSPWLTATGLVVRGYYSPIDGSAQPFGLEIPEKTPAINAPAWFWLQGRGDTRTDLHFIAGHLKKGGEFKPPGTIIVHPWGRYCLGFKGPGEQDVLAVRQLLIDEKRIDPSRTALAGFSMGGAGAWLLGAHYPGHWAVVHTGAGFVDVRRYQNYSEAKIAATPAWEQTLWSLNDVPDYTRNLLNVPVISYSGEKDPQRASAEIMAESFQQHGAALTRYIGPGMGHQYDPAVRQQIEDKVQAALLNPILPYPLKLSFQTRTLAYSRLHWLQITGLQEHWRDTRINASLDAPFPQATGIKLTTLNTAAFSITPPDQTILATPLTLTIDGQTLHAPPGSAIHLIRQGETWALGVPSSSLRKKPGLQGPIDDAFNGPFLHVLPDKPGFHPDTDLWVETESAAQLSRWRTLFRGDARVKKACEVTAEDRQQFHLILWGDPASNSLIAETLAALPIQWNKELLTAHGQTYSTAGHLPVFIYPAPGGNQRYLVINSGPTWREAHSKTNSQQNPKLPDWAVLDITSPPTPEAAGRPEAAGFFSESWGWK